LLQDEKPHKTEKLSSAVPITSLTEISKELIIPYFFNFNDITFRSKVTLGTMFEKEKQ